MAATISEPRRYAELDVMRAIAIVGVVAIHASVGTIAATGAGSFEALFYVVLNQLSRFCVPVFLLVSGILAYRSYGKYRYASLLAARAADLLVPYLVWTVLGFLFFLAYAVTYKGIVLAFLTGSGPFYQLYYIPLLLQLFVLLPLLIKLASSGKRVAILFVLTAAACTGYQAELIGFPLSESISSLLALLAQSTFVLWMAYFCAGLWIARHYDKLHRYVASTPMSKLLIAFLIAAIIMVIEAVLMMEAKKPPGLLNYFRVTVMLYSFASFGLLFKLGLIYKPILLSKLYQHSFGIYLVHVAVLKLIPAGWHARLSAAVDLPVTIIITLAISYGVVEVIARIPLLSRLLLGRQRAAGRSGVRRVGNQMKNVTEGGER